jgi:hypothetical protein
VPTTDKQQTATTQRRSSPASVLSLSVVIAALTLGHHGGALLSFLVGLGSFFVFSFLTVLGGIARHEDLSTGPSDKPAPRVVGVSDILRSDIISQIVQEQRQLLESRERLERNLRGEK